MIKLKRTDSMKGRILYWIFFILLLVLVSYIYRYFYMHILSSQWRQDVMFTILIVLVYFVAIIPLTAYISEKLIVFSLSKGWVLTTLLLVIPVILIPLNIYNEYREKGLDEVINYDISDVQALVFYEGHEQHQWKTDEKEHSEVLKDFLSQYRVKKMNDDEWDSNVSEEKGFQVTIYFKDKIIMSSIFESRLMIMGIPSGPYYRIVNGPIDFEWVENYVKEHRD